ncbi:MAG: GNAT family N-acetyltransferase [Firmicutes bacterium]|nr:GNAT family N-acetyltransferase [Bacillota bacterium]
MRFEPSMKMKIDILPEQEDQLCSKATIIKIMEKGDDKVLSFDIYDGDDLVGFAMFNAWPEDTRDGFFLWNYAIDAKHQNRGLGTKALKELMDYMVANHGAKMFTTTYMWGNEVAKRMYEKVGFVETNVVEEEDFKEVNMECINTIWSNHVQGVMTLYLSRKLRFDDAFFSQYERLFALERGKELKILEVGCGPGALSESLHRWYENARITAIDRDIRFIEFAKAHIDGVEFLEGDATCLPFEDELFDVVISNTVQEHIEPEAFWGEQRRVLKPGGVCLCLSARQGISRPATCMEMTSEEKELWDSIPESENSIGNFGVGKFKLSEEVLPAMMESHGFKDVTTGYAVIDLTPDDPKYSPEFAETIIEEARQERLESIRSAQTEDETLEEKAIRAVNNKCDERLRLYHGGIKQWDTTVSIIMVLRGTK